MGAYVLETHDLSFAYGRGAAARAVLSQVSLGISRGSAVGLLGPNGSGKTTLLRLMAGVLTPTHGTVTLDGQPIDRMPRRDLAKRIAVVPQETRATFDFTVLEMVLMGRYPHLGPFELEGPADVEIARAALQATGTSALEHRLFATLSGGEKQRVIIAAALAQASDLLLLDEPTTALDLRYQFEILGVLRSLSVERGATLVVSTHDLNLAAALCQRVILLKDGRVIANGPTDQTLTAANIRALYDVDADVQFHSRAGHLTVVPYERPR
ncbi:MAG TPA: ABC transporter ATP-binding protein [Vicinamibacterales bacterium]|nr:ABC transporter ATP-binding protein [Vicinamibacterales bacterium]